MHPIGIERGFKMPLRSLTVEAISISFSFTNVTTPKVVLGCKGFLAAP